jgi:hypothetical protein
VINRFGNNGIFLLDCCAVPPTLGDNVVQGNFVGTDVTGTIDLGNSRAGVLLYNTIRNLIGGTGAGEGNLISGNGGGIVFFHPESKENLVQGNLIGTQKDGSSPLGNGVGVQISSGGSNNVVGGTVPGAGNTIAFNQNSGIDVAFAAPPAVGNAILGNSIFSNRTLGIDLNADLVTFNDPGDADSGANNLQNFPVITSATSGGGTTTVQGTLNSEANKTYRLEFFSNHECDQEPEVFLHGEGETFIGSRNVTTDGGGDASFTFTAGTATPLGHVITSTATDPDNNTSEFSRCQPVVAGPGAPATLTLSPAADTNDVDTEHCVTATVEDASGNPVPNVTVRFSVTGAVNTSGSATTDASGEAEFCYQGPELPGADAITAFADTDNDQTQDAGEPAGAAEKTWVLPVSTPLCEVKLTKGGRITADNGDRATFGGNAKVSELGVPNGSEEYQDHGPAQPLNVKSTQILALFCPSSTEATIFGLATIDGGGTHLFKIDVEDLGEPGVGADTYRILLDTTYDSGRNTLEGGNVQIHKG